MNLTQLRYLRGIAEQVGGARKAAGDHAAVTRKRFIALAGATENVNRELGVKGRVKRENC